MRTVLHIRRCNDKGEEKQQRLELPQFEKNGFFGIVELIFENGSCVSNVVKPMVKLPIMTE
jgi:hypothetical protein